MYEGDFKNIPSDSLIIPILVTCIATTLLMTSCVLARLILRIKGQGKCFVEDLFLVVGYIFTIAYIGSSIVALKYGMGVREKDVPMELNIEFMKPALYQPLFFSFAVTFPKISLCVTYLRLFRLSRPNAWFCYVMIAFQIAITVIINAVYYKECGLQAWIDPVAHKRCTDTQGIVIANAAMNSFTDIMVYLWPVSILWRLRLPKEQRLGAALFFAMGVLVCIPGAARCVCIPLAFNGWDGLYGVGVLNITTVLEGGSGVAFACLHVMRPVMLRLFPKFYTHFTSREQCCHVMVTGDGLQPTEHQKDNDDVDAVTTSIIPGQLSAKSTSDNLKGEIAIIEKSGDDKV